MMMILHMLTKQNIMYDVKVLENIINIYSSLLECFVGEWLSPNSVLVLSSAAGRGVDFDSV